MFSNLVEIFHESYANMAVFILRDLWNKYTIVFKEMA